MDNFKNAYAVLQEYPVVLMTLVAMAAFGAIYVIAHFTESGSASGELKIPGRARRAQRYERYRAVAVCTAHTIVSNTCARWLWWCTYASDDGCDPNCAWSTVALTGAADAAAWPTVARCRTPPGPGTLERCRQVWRIHTCQARNHR